MPHTTSTSTPSAVERCDRRGARAKARALLEGGGELVFGGHHTREHQYALREQRAHIVAPL